MQRIDQSVVEAVNSRTDAVLNGMKNAPETLRLKGRNPKAPNAIRRSSAKFNVEESVNCWFYWLLR
jgi:hypothetical protein